jgi:ATP-binding cassette subfamily B protein RaxB
MQDGVYQSESAECGLACIATCLRMLGGGIEMSTLRYRFQLGSSGMTLRAITQIAGALDLSTRAVRCETDELRKLALPAILHWEFNHFVVLTGFGRKGSVEIFDPATGRRLVDAREVDRAFTGVALEVSPAEGFERRKERSALGVFGLFKFRAPLVSGLSKALLLSLVMQLYVLGSPFFLQLAVDEAALKADLNLLLILAIGFGAFALFNAVAEALRGYTLQFVNAVLGWEMTTRLFHHMVRLPLQWFQRRKLADALTRFDSLEPIKALISGGLVAGVLDGLLALTLVVMMFVYSSTLAWIVIVSAFVTAAIKLGTAQRAMELGSRALQASIAEKGKRIETLRSIQTIKLMSGEVGRETDWASRFGDAVSTAQDSARFQVLLRATYTAIDTVSFVIVVYFASVNVIGAAMSLGMLYAFVSYRQQFVSRFNTLIDQIVAWRLLDVHLDRIADISLSKREPNVDASGVLAQQFLGRIELQGVGFRYSEHEPWVLRGIDLIVEPGELVAIVGSSGGGKSTLLKVLTGLYPATSGVVKFDGVAATTLGAYAVRSNIAAVMQDDEALSGSIAENVAFFADRVEMDRVWMALREAGLEEDVRAMPMQQHTLIGDMGSSLSGGQRQRLLLARAIYRQPRILILDEATSNLDVKRERALHDRLREMAITRIFVTHRPEAAKLADRVFLLKDGRLAELRRDDVPATVVAT